LRRAASSARTALAVVAVVSLLSLLTLLTIACSNKSSQDACTICQPAPSVCNGHAELCDRTYDRVSFPGTHDAYANRAENYTSADQSYTLTKQLQDGVRVLHLEMLPNIPTYDTALLCHGLCAFGQKPLADGLREVKTFLDANPNEVVTLLTEAQKLTTDVIAQGFDQSGITPMLRTQQKGAPWPTLSEMIQSGQRVIVFYADMSSTGGTSFPWMHDRFSFTWETPWNNVTLADFGRCNADRGTMSVGLYVVDTYLEDMDFQTAQNAARVNANPFLLDRLLDCQRTTGVQPSFVMVNYYEVGDLFHDVDVLNGFATPMPADAGATPPPAFDDAGTD
jgi:hypothetical protein